MFDLENHKKDIIDSIDKVTNKLEDVHDTITDLLTKDNITDLEIDAITENFHNVNEELNELSFNVVTINHEQFEIINRLYLLFEDVYIAVNEFYERVDKLDNLDKLTYLDKLDNILILTDRLDTIIDYLYSALFIYAPLIIIVIGLWWFFKQFISRYY